MLRVTAQLSQLGLSLKEQRHVGRHESHRGFLRRFSQAAVGRGRIASEQRAEIGRESRSGGPCDLLNRTTWIVDPVVGPAAAADAIPNTAFDVSAFMESEDMILP